MKKIFCFSLCLFFTSPLWANNDGPLTIKIKMEKDTYQVGEPIDGKIVVRNTMAGDFPAIFNIKLYHEKKLFAEYRTELKRAYFGTTEYFFKNFGIPPFNDSSAAEGEWNVGIVQQDLDVSHAQWVTIHIIPVQNKEEER